MMELPKITCCMLDRPPLDLMGQKWMIEGLLKISTQHAFIEINNDILTCKLGILDPSLVERLLVAIPCAVGGAYLYCEQASLIGIVDEVDGKLVISALISGALYMDDATFHF